MPVASLRATKGAMSEAVKAMRLFMPLHYE